MTTHPIPSEPAAVAARRLVAAVGGHAAGELGLDLASGDDRDLGRWLVACCLRAPGRREGLAHAAFRALADAGLADPAALAKGDVARVAAAFEGVGVGKPPVLAARLVRAARTLAERYGSSVGALLRRAESLDELGASLTSLTPGFGAAAAAAFLAPLRPLSALADDLPLSPPACAAAVHLGWIDADRDPGTAVGAVREALSHEGAAPAFADLEAALGRLGRRACLRGATARCPLAEHCPARHRME